MKIITIAEVEYLAFRLAKELLTYDEPSPPMDIGGLGEPIPDFSTRFPNILESCLLTPFQSFEKKDLYRGLIPKASILFYLIIKNHPFQNGNKRIAMTTLFTFLYLNKKWIKVDSQELYNFAIWVAQSPPRLKDETVKAVEKFVKTYIVAL